MAWLNYHHLLYFWTVAREGGLGPAAAALHLTRPTLSAQIKALEHSLGEKLFERSGRRLVLTDAGRVAVRYAEEIFALGREMQDTLRGGTARGVRFDVGVADVLPKLVVRRLLEPALALPGVHLVCREDTHDRLLAMLADHELHIVLADAPVPAGSVVRAYNHPLGECGVTWFAAAPHASLATGFPRSLDGAPVLLPLAGTALRRALDGWFHAEGLRPRVVAEFEDSALLKVFGSDGLGAFCAPSVVEKAVVQQYRVRVIGRTDQVRESFFAISAERRLKHPAVVAISEGARNELFAPRRRSAR